MRNSTATCYIMKTKQQHYCNTINKNKKKYKKKFSETTKSSNDLGRTSSWRDGFKTISDRELLAGKKERINKIHPSLRRG